MEGKCHVGYGRLWDRSVLAGLSMAVVTADPLLFQVPHHPSTPPPRTSPPSPSSTLFNTLLSIAKARMSAA